MHPGSTGTTASRLDIKASMALAQRPSGLSTTTRPLHARNTARCGAGGAGAPAARGKVPAARRALILASWAHRAPQSHPGVNRGPTRASTGRGGTARATVTLTSPPGRRSAPPTPQHKAKVAPQGLGWAKAWPSGRRRPRRPGGGQAWLRSVCRTQGAARRRRARAGRAGGQATPSGAQRRPDVAYCRGKSPRTPACLRPPRPRQGARMPPVSALPARRARRRSAAAAAAAGKRRSRSPRRA